MTESRTHFSLFSLPESFALDGEELRERYRRLQQSLHPDRHSGADATQRRLSLQYAAMVNDAFQVLRSPVRRARYLLKLNGVDVDLNAGNQLDPCFLMRQMELRESLADVEEASQPEVAIQKLREEIDAEIVEMERVLASQFADGRAEALRKAARLVQELQFMCKLAEEAGQIESRLQES